MISQVNSQLQNNKNVVIFNTVAGTFVNINFLFLVGIWLVKIGSQNAKLNQKYVKTVGNLMTPCLIFAYFIRDFDFYDFSSWVPLLAFIVIQISVGISLGYLVNKYYVKSKTHSAIFMLSSGLAHSAGILIITVEMLGQSGILQQIQEVNGYQPKQNPNAYNRGMSYAMQVLLINRVIWWSVGKQIALSQFQDQVEVPHHTQHITHLLVKHQQPIQKNLLLEFWHKIQKEMNPPLWGAFFAILFCILYPIQSYIRQSGNAINVIFLQTTLIIGDLNPPTTLILVGANLANLDTKNATMKDKVLYTSTILRLGVMMVFGSFLIYFFIKFRIIQDPSCILLLFIIVSGPVAVQLLVVVGFYTDNVNLMSDISKLIYFQYLIYLIIWYPIMIWTYLWVFLK